MSANRRSATSRSLSPSALERIRSGWAERLKVPAEALTSAGQHVFTREAASAVVVLQLGDSLLVVAPPPAALVLDGIAERTLLDLHALTAVLGEYDPQPIGTAALLYADSHTVDQPKIDTRSVEPAVADELRAHIQADEWDESGLSTMPHLWAAFTPAGDLAAVAGYELWGSSIAQIGVASVVAERGRGYAVAATFAAMTQALDAGLVLQWRSRVGNVPSDRLAARLGFTSLGFQSAVALG